MRQAARACKQSVLRHLPSATYASMLRPRGRAAERGTLGEQHHPIGNEQMSKQRTIWSGLALIIAGGVFLAATNGAGRSSKLGLIIGGVIIVLGLVRMLRARREAPPPV